MSIRAFIVFTAIVLLAHNCKCRKLIFDDFFQDYYSRFPNSQNPGGAEKRGDDKYSGLLPGPTFPTFKPNDSVIDISASPPQDSPQLQEYSHKRSDVSGLRAYERSSEKRNQYPYFTGFPKNIYNSPCYDYCNHLV